MPDRPYSRRDFLLRLGLAGAAVPLIGAGATGRFDRGADPDPEADPCPGLDDLTEDELTVRRRLRYVDESPEEGRRCDNCALVVAEARFRPCMGCRVVPGPVARAGWCAAWVAAK